MNFGNKTSKLLFSMWCQIVKGIRKIKKKISNENIIRPIQWQNKNDTQAHMLNCEEVIKILAKIIRKNMT